MATSTNSPSGRLNRRTILKVSLGGIIGSSRLARPLAKNDFWNVKEASEWRDSERERLLNNSPWAKNVTPSMGGGGGPDFDGPPGGGFPGGGGDFGGPGSGFPDFQMTVRWESAAPVRMASKDSVPDDPGAYLISVSAGPRGGRGQQPEFDPPGGFAGSGEPASMARAAQLEIKGQPAIHAAKAERLESDRMLLLFLFERAGLPIAPSMKEVVFSLQMGPMELKAKFSPKEMMYKGRLSI